MAGIFVLEELVVSVCFNNLAKGLPSRLPQGRASPTAPGSKHVVRKNRSEVEAGNTAPATAKANRKSFSGN